MIATKFISADGTEIDLGRVDEKVVAETKKAALDLGGEIAGINIMMQSAPYLVPVFGRVRLEVTVGDETFLGGVLNIQPEAAKA
jgi:hypothetical protein